MKKWVCFAAACLLVIGLLGVPAVSAEVQAVGRRELLPSTAGGFSAEGEIPSWDGSAFCFQEGKFAIHYLPGLLPLYSSDRLRYRFTAAGPSNIYLLLEDMSEFKLSELVAAQHGVTLTWDGQLPAGTYEGEVLLPQTDKQLYFFKIGKADDYRISELYLTVDETADERGLLPADPSGFSAEGEIPVLSDGVYQFSKAQLSVCYPTAQIPIYAYDGLFYDFSAAAPMNVYLILDDHTEIKLSELVAAQHGVTLTWDGQLPAGVYQGRVTLGSAGKRINFYKIGKSGGLSVTRLALRFDDRAAVYFESDIQVRTRRGYTDAPGREPAVDANENTWYDAYDLGFTFQLNGWAYDQLAPWITEIRATVAYQAGGQAVSLDISVPYVEKDAQTGRYRYTVYAPGIAEADFGSIVTAVSCLNYRDAEGQLHTVNSAPVSASVMEEITAGRAPLYKPYITFSNTDADASIGVWWWDTAAACDAAQATGNLNFLQRNQVRDIYLWAYGMTDSQLDAFIRQAGDRGMRVAFLLGDPSWVEPGNAGVEEFLDFFHAYQASAAADAKFYGLHFDVEPQLGTDPDGKMQALAEFIVQKARPAAVRDGVLLECDVSAWSNLYTVTYQGQPVNFADFITRVCDTVGIMSYRDTAAVMYEISEQEIGYAKQNGCRIVLGAETGASSEGGFITYREEGRIYMCAQLEQLNDMLKESGVSDFGIAIHDITQWLTLPD